MKLTIIFLFLAGCVSKQFYQKQIDERTKEIIFLQKSREHETRELRLKIEQIKKQQAKKMIFRVINKECKIEQPSQKQEKIKTICIDDGEEQTCVDFIPGGE